MKAKYLMTALGVVFFQAVAFAEMVSGTVTGVDLAAQKVTLRQEGTNESVEIHVKEARGLADLKTGDKLSLDASKRVLGGWEAQTVNPMEKSGVPSADSSQAAAASSGNSERY